MSLFKFENNTKNQFIIVVMLMLSFIMYNWEASKALMKDLKTVGIAPIRMK